MKPQLHAGNSGARHLRQLSGTNDKLKGQQPMSAQVSLVAETKHFGGNITTDRFASSRQGGLAIDA